MTAGRRRLLLLAAVAVGLAGLVGWGLLAGDSGPASGGEALKVSRLRRAGRADKLVELVAGSDDSLSGEACEALAEMGPPAMEAIRGRLDHSAPVVRERLATAMSKLGAAAAATDLARLAGSDPVADVRAAAVAGLNRMMAYECIETLLSAMDDRDELVRLRAYAAVRRLACATVPYDPAAPQAERRQAIDHLRRHWRVHRDRAAAYWRRLRGSAAPARPGDR